MLRQGNVTKYLYSVPSRCLCKGTLCARLNDVKCHYINEYVH